MGSGVILDTDGRILTNNHVVADATVLRVRLDDDREFDAEIVGTDPKSDLAVIQIDAKKLKPARLSNSDKVRVGQWVLAAGSPFGLPRTVTAGIVSATGRGSMGIADYGDFIQTDARGQSGELGRSAHRSGRARHRDQHRHRLAQRRQQRDRVRDPDQPGAQCRRSARHGRGRAAGLARDRDGRPRQGHGQVVRLQGDGRDPDQRRGSEGPGGQSRGQDRRHHREAGRQGRGPHGRLPQRDRADAAGQDDQAVAVAGQGVQDRVGEARRAAGLARREAPQGDQAEEIEERPGQARAVAAGTHPTA